MKIGVYKITSPKGKIYIGQSTDIEYRWRVYKKLNCKQQPKIYNSLKKYGPENHKFEVIELCSEEQLIERETYWKVFYKVLEIPSLCCKIDGKGGRDSKITKKRKSLAKLGKPCVKKGGKYPKDPLTYKLNGKEKLILKLYNKYTTMQIAEKLNCDVGTIITHLKSVGKFEKYKNRKSPSKTHKKKMSLIMLNKLGKPVLKYTLNREFLEEYPSAAEAGRSLGKKGSCIQDCANGKAKKAYGFYWEWKN